MEKELKSLNDNKTWDLVTLPVRRKAFPNKWVYSYVTGPKLSDGDQVMEKARLVTRGDFQREGIDYKETYAPVVKFVSLRILLTWAAKKRLKTRHWDIVSAFLHGVLDLEVYMQQPQGFSDGTNRVCRLNKAIYGLCQAARCFYIRLDEILKKIGYKRLAADWAIWIRHDGAFIAVHVDDMAAAAENDRALDDISTVFGEFMELKDLGEIRDYLSISMHFDSSKNVFLLSQEHYILKLLSEYGMDTAFEVQIPALESDKEK